MADQSLQWLAGPGGTTTDTKAITVSAGSTIVAWLTDGSTNSVSGFGVSDGTAYTAATNSAVDGSNFVAGKIFYLQNATAGVHTVVGTTGGSAAQIFVSEVPSTATGAHIADAAQFLNAPTTSANDVTSGNMTIATAVTILALATDSSVVNAGNEPTVGTGFTSRLAGTGSIGSWRLETGSASTTSAATFTAIANNPHVIWAIAIANAAASGAIAGTSALAFGASGTLASQGAMAGTAGLTFGAMATPIIPPLQYSDTASNRNRPGRGPYSTGRFFVSDISAYSAANSVGALAGTSALTFSETGLLAGAGALAGTSALVVGESGALTGSGALAATSSLLFGESGALTGSGAMSATAGLVLAETGVLTGAGSLAGTSALIFSASGALIQPGISGTAALVMGQTGVIAGAGALAASCQLIFASASTLTGIGALAGTSALTFAASATATLPGALSGTASASFGSNATIQATGFLAGESDIRFDASAVNTQTSQPGPVDSGVTMSDGAYRKKRQKRIIERLVARPTPKGEPQPIFAPEFVPITKPTRVPRETTSLADIAKPVDLTNDDEEAMAAILNALDQLEDDD